MQDISEPSELDKARLDYAWKWFDFHAKQRMQLFNFFLIITGVLATAYASAFEKGLLFLALLVGVIGFLQAAAFFVFDIRSRTLTEYSENVLSRIEEDVLFADFARAGAKLGLTIVDNEKWYLKMKYWIRAIEALVAVCFVIGIFFSLTAM